jgi:hypothetical protein
MPNLIKQITKLQDLDNEISVQNIRRATQAQIIASGGTNVVNTPLTPIDEDMIREYELSKIRPFYDEQTQRELKYNLPDEQLEYDDLEYYGDDTRYKKKLDKREKQFRDKLRKLSDEVKTRQDDITKKTNEIKKIEDDINKTINRALLKQLRRQRTTKINEILTLKAEIADKEMEIQTELTLLGEQQAIIGDADAEIRRKKEYNNEQIKQYQDKLNVLNNGVFNHQPMIGESDAEYLQRLKQASQADYEQEVLHNSKVFTKRKMKKKLEELIKSPSIIEALLNYYDDEKFHILLKLWGTVKEKYFKTFGQYNKFTTIDDNIKFFNFFIVNNEEVFNNIIGQQPKSSTSQYQGDDTGPNKAIDVDILDNDFKLINHKNKKTLFLRPILLGDRPNLLYSFTGKEGSYVQYFDETIKYQNNRSRNSEKVILDKTGITSQDINNFVLKYDSDYLEPGSIAQTLHLTFLIPFTEEAKANTKPITIGNKKDSGVEYGMGIKQEQIPNIVQLGKVYILLHKLYYENILSVKNKQNNQIAGFKTQKVSEKLVKIILNLCGKMYPNFTDISALSPNEKQLYDKLISVANLHKTVINQKDVSINNLKSRMKSIEEAIEIGNDSPILMKELKDILISLKHFKVITQKQMTDYLNQLK